MSTFNFFILSLKEFLRQPMFVVSTLLFPSMFFWFFGVPNATDQASATLLMCSFSCFAVLGVLLFQLAVQISQERSSPWMRYLQTVPVRELNLTLARVGASFVLSILAIALVVATTFATTNFDGTDFPWVQFFAALMLGGIPFALMALVMGYIIKGKAILPVANMIYLPLSFAGGLWLPPNALPKVIQDISEYLPTRHFGEVVWAVAFKKEIPEAAAKGLVIYALIYIFIFLVILKQKSWTEKTA